MIHSEPRDALLSGERGDPAALLEAYRNYLRLLARNWVDASLQGKADPSDLVQETLWRATQGWGEFRGGSEGELVAWLRQILARCAIDFVRKFRLAEGRDVGRERSIEQHLEASSLCLGKFLAASGTSPSLAAQRRELSVVLADALADLSGDQREAIILRSLQELDWGDVAERMGRTVGAVRMLWARGLQQLRPKIEARL